MNTLACSSFDNQQFECWLPTFAKVRFHTTEFEQGREFFPEFGKLLKQICPSLQLSHWAQNPLS